jgi:hypothetical protein
MMAVISLVAVVLSLSLVGAARAQWSFAGAIGTELSFPCLASDPDSGRSPGEPAIAYLFGGRNSSGYTNSDEFFQLSVLAPHENRTGASNHTQLSVVNGPSPRGGAVCGFQD